MLSPFRLFMSVAPKPLNPAGLFVFGFYYIAVRNARHSGLKNRAKTKKVARKILRRV